MEKNTLVKKFYLKKTVTKLEKSYKIDYEKELNECQLQAVMHNEGPLLIIAGAGSGKTKTLTLRVAKLIEDGISPDNILLLTFTRRAAKEMISRVESILNSNLKKIEGGTFHSFANLILRKYAKFADLKNNFTVMDRSDAEDVVNHIRQKVIEKKEKRFPKKSTILDIYSKTINKDIPIDDIMATEYKHFEHCTEKIKTIACQYKEYKQEHSLLDYDDLLLYLKALLLSNESIREQIGKKYKYVLIDEYQDTNSLQAQIVRLISSVHNNVTAVGDDSQSIYSFRGANYKNILDFPKQYQNCKIITLEQNYRSSQNILNLANEVLKKAKEKYTKELFSTIKSEEKPIMIRCENTHSEGEFVVQRILELSNEENISLDEIAVLTRSASLMFDVETELLKQKIPYQKIGGLKFTEMAHIKDIMAYLRIILNPFDEISLNRILLLEKGIGTSTINRLLPILTQQGSKTTIDMLPVKPSQKQDLNGLLKLLSEARKEIAEPHKVTEKVLNYYEHILMEHYDDADKRLKDFDHILYLSSKQLKLEDFLSDMALEPPNSSITDIEEGADKDECLTLSTIHGAKGTEYKAVFIIGAVDGRFPSLYSFNSSEELEEELRLFYVAITRAKEYLYISYPVDMFDRSTGMVFSKPCRFTDDIPEDILERYELAEN
jgi:DNA helicase-2/ATP-dependent DNA helicase PcrA